jgi:hypothetical protein
MEEAIVADLQQYLAEPTAERFLDLRAAVSESPEYAPYAVSLDRGWELFDEGRFEEAKNFLLSMMPNWILNPGIHQMLSFAWHKVGQEEAAQYELAVAMALLNGILSTGDGTMARPYRAMHTRDEYDVLAYLGKRSVGQALVEHGEEHCDRQTCDDGTEIWFDVTVPYAHLRRRHSSWV